MKKFLKIIIILFMLFSFVQIKAQDQTIFDLYIVGEIDDSIYLIWTHVPGVQYYNIYRSFFPEGPYNLICQRMTIDYEFYIDYGLDYGKYYYYVVSSVDNLGRESSFSNEVKIIIYQKLRI